MLCLVGVFWVGMVDDGDYAPAATEYSTAAAEPSTAATVSAGELDVPVYYFPDAATGTDRYVDSRDADCGGTTAAAPVDYPKDWLKP